MRDRARARARAGARYGKRAGSTGRRARVFAAGALCLLALAASSSCFERGDRWLEEEPISPICKAGTKRCTTGVEVCEGIGGFAKWTNVDDCAARGKVCVESDFTCKTCLPASYFCEGRDVYLCGDDGESKTKVQTCDAEQGLACRVGSCQKLCTVAAQQKSNVGCEYWAVDLDNANIDATSNAAAQQFAVVVSNPQPDVPIKVRIEQDDTLPGEEGEPFEIATATIAPLNLEVFKLGPREVDGSPPGEFDTGTHTALTRAAYKVTTDFPVVVYQFNPLENVSVFSNDASLLYPKEAFASAVGSFPAYVALSWPQTIAATDDPNTNFNPLDPINLRAFLTIVGTEDETVVRVVSSTRVVEGGPVTETQPGETIEATIGAFDVLNLETEDFMADFSGSIVYADKPIAVFVGGEASDAPHWETLGQRQCCADHLEDQLPPIRTAGKVFAIPHTPHRGRAVTAAGASIGEIPEIEFVRFMSTTDAGATVTTTLPPPDDRLVLTGIGDVAEVAVFGDFMASSDQPILVAQIMASQQATSPKQQGMPGGDPSLMMVPPLEQARTEYVFLTPDKYAFDYVTIVAPFGATVLLDDQPLSESICEVAAADGLTAEQRGSGDPPYFVYRCQLSFPTIDPSTSPPTISLGSQNDGVHRVSANAKVFVAVTGFDAYVSYAYAAGTELIELAPPQ
ncbi:MAG: hypothetical protein HOV80_28275 [Polyangiaceae bacterium]|nr:hypothetical protein [Polyangiaceae bacterium]